jgi:hypothetical protein
MLFFGILAAENQHFGRLTHISMAYRINVPRICLPFIVLVLLLVLVRVLVLERLDDEYEYAYEYDCLRIA